MNNHAINSKRTKGYGKRGHEIWGDTKSRGIKGV